MSEAILRSHSYADRKTLAWWGAISILGAVCWVVPTLVGLKESSALLVSAISLLLVGAVTGFLIPMKPWRWAIASVLLLPIVDVVTIVAGAESLGMLADPLPHLLAKAGIYGLQAVPTLFGAYLGAEVRMGQSGSLRLRRLTHVEWRWWIMAGVLTTLSLVLPLTIDLDSFTFMFVGSVNGMVIGILVSAFIMGMVQPAMAHKWVVFFGVIPYAHLALIMPYEELESLPFLVFLGFMLGFPPAYVGAHLGSWISRNVIGVLRGAERSAAPGPEVFDGSSELQRPPAAPPARRE